MAVTSYKASGTRQSFADTIGQVNWTNLANLASDNASYATCSNISAWATVYSYAIAVYNFGFTSSDIAPGNNIVGVELLVNRRYQSFACKDYKVGLTLNGSATTPTLAGSNVADTTNNWTSSDADKVYGGPTDTMGATLTQSNVTSSDFGAIITVQGAAAFANQGNAQIDYMAIRIYHETPSGIVVPLMMMMGCGT